MANIKRTQLSKKIETKVLVACRRRCCLCYFLKNLNEPKKGQIAHINKDRTQSVYSNLVYLCLEHHDEFDSSTSQSKGFTSEEVKMYRNKLYKELGTEGSLSSVSGEYALMDVPIPCIFKKINLIDRNLFSSHWLDEPWQLWTPMEGEKKLFAYKSPNRCDGICRIECIKLVDGRTAILCEEIDENPGMSVTNAIEYVALQVCEQYEIEPSKLVWIEHYDTSFAKESEWDLVTFEKIPPKGIFDEPHWKPMIVNDWEALGLSPRSKGLTSKESE